MFSNICNQLFCFGNSVEQDRQLEEQFSTSYNAQPNMSRMPLVAKQYAEKQRLKRAKGAQRIGADNFKPSGSIRFCGPHNENSSKSPVKRAK